MRLRAFKRDQRSATVDWRPFVDAMTALLLVCLLIMTVVIALSYYRVVISKAKDVEQKAIEQANKEEQERIDAERKRLSEDVQAILMQRKQVYQSVYDAMVEQNESLRDVVKLTESGISINADMLFDYNKDTLSREGKILAKELGLAFFKVIDNQLNNETADTTTRILYIEVSGHTDNRGSDGRNRYLSMNRAGNFVEEMFIQNKIPDEKKSVYAKYIKSSGMSKYQPKEGTVLEQTSDQQDQNRRIEFSIIFTDDDFVYLQEKYSNID